MQPSESQPEVATDGASSSHTPLPCIYVQCQSPFPQVETFVDECQARYNLDLMRINAGMKDALAQYKIQRDAQGKGVEAVLVGTRVGDPYSGTSLARGTLGFADYRLQTSCCLFSSRTPAGRI